MSGSVPQRTFLQYIWYELVLWACQKVKFHLATYNATRFRIFLSRLILQKTNYGLMLREKTLLQQHNVYYINRRAKKIFLKITHEMKLHPNRQDYISLRTVSHYLILQSRGRSLICFDFLSLNGFTLHTYKSEY